MLGLHAMLEQFVDELIEEVCSNVELQELQVNLLKYFTVQSIQNV